MVMFFGITNSPTTFQAIINEILRDIINKGKMTTFVYIDWNRNRRRI